MVKLSIVDTGVLKTPELDALAQELIDQVRFASGKAMAHFSEPSRYPLPADKGALERILVDAARDMGDAERQNLLKIKGRTFAANPLAAIDRSQRDLFEAVDLRSDVAVLDQIAARLKLHRAVFGGQHVMSGNLPSPTDEPTVQTHNQ